MTGDGHQWGHGGVRRFRESEIDARLAQALAVRQVTALTHLPTGVGDPADGAITFHPGSAAIDHAAGPDECLYVVVRGEILLRWGDALGHSGVAGAGDLVLVPPWTRHVESNASNSEPLERLLMTTN